MARFRTKGHEIQAEQFHLDKPLPFNDVGPVVMYDEGLFCVETIGGRRIPLHDGDWVILEPGSKTCAYPCPPSVFAARYDLCNEATTAKPVALRLQDEKRELDDRIERLMRFIGDCSQPSEFLLLPSAVQSKLRVQLAIMQAYSTALGERLAHMVSDNSPVESAVPKDPTMPIEAQWAVIDCLVVCHWIINQNDSGSRQIPSSIAEKAKRGHATLSGLLESPGTIR